VTVGAGNPSPGWEKGRDEGPPLVARGATAPLGLLLQRQALIRRSAPPSPIREKGRGGAAPADLSPHPEPMPILLPLRPTKGAVARHRAAGRGCGFRRLRPLRAEGGGGADRHRAGESGRATRGTNNQKAIWSAQKTCARGGVAAVGAASTRHSTSTSARSRRLRRHHRPAHPLGSAFEEPETPRREPVGAFGASGRKALILSPSFRGFAQRRARNPEPQFAEIRRAMPAPRFRKGVGSGFRARPSGAPE
jgi:hypothetical protein